MALDSNVMPQGKMHAHTMIIGGTGMFLAAAVKLAAQSHRPTSVARTQRSLVALDDILPKPHSTHHMLQLDGSDPDAFLGDIEQHARKVAPPDLVLAWTLAAIQAQLPQFVVGNVRQS